MQHIYKLIITLIGLIGYPTLWGQHQEILEKPALYQNEQIKVEDSTSLWSAFKRGQVNGHFRYFFMSTQNKSDYSDYYAHAAGGGLRFKTAQFHKFQFTLSGFYTFNVGSSDLGKQDSATGQSNRYEIGLFDIQDPYNKKDISRLEEFNLTYFYKKSSIIFGRQLINTPFINLQDGRMRATGVEGLWFELNDIKNTTLEGGWLYSISPRSTTKWFDIGKSMAIYPVGVNPDGTKSQYINNLSSAGVFMLGMHFKIKKHLEIQAWNLYTQNIFNSLLLQADWRFPLKNQSALTLAGQFVREDAIGHGGNEDNSKTYMAKDAKAVTFGAKVGWKNKAWEASLNYNRITSAGRYLIPREWGRDPFFTFMPRERNEGLGDTHAFMSKINHNFQKSNFKTSLALGYFKLPDVKNYRLNKYGLPSYAQINGDMRYIFDHSLKGLELQILVVGKLKVGDTYGIGKYEINKVHMMQYNVVLNYRF